VWNQEECVAAYEAWNEHRATEIIGAHAGREGATLPLLHALQDAFGCIPGDAVPLVAQTLNLSRAEVYGIVSFYHEFRREPPGRHILQLCRAEACQSLGSEAVQEHVCKRLQVGWHETTRDRAVTLEPVFCLGLCAVGPAALLDGQPIGRLSATRIDAALESIT